MPGTTLLGTFLTQSIGTCSSFLWANTLVALNIQNRILILGLFFRDYAFY